MGLDAPLWVQYFEFLRNMLTLDFGRSLINGREVIDLITTNTFFIGVYPGLTPEMIAHVLGTIDDFMAEKNR